MSQYLVIQKNNTTLGEWSRATPIYQAFHCASYEVTEFNPEFTFTEAKQSLLDDKASYEKTLAKYEKMFSNSLSYEERWDILSSIDDLKEEIARINRYIHYIDFMYESWECDKYGEEKAVWTCYIA